MNRTHEPPSRCPVCQGKISIMALACDECDSELRGRFSLPALARLPREYQRIVELLVRCRGNLKELERELGISYPTVSKKLDAINMMLEATADAGGEGEVILQKVQDGEMNVQEAVRQLRELKQAETSQDTPKE